MEALVKRLEQLENAEIDWEELALNNYNIDYDMPYAETLSDVMIDIRTLLKKSPKGEQVERLKELADRFSWFSGMLECMNKSLIYYRNLAALRTLGEKGGNLVNGFLSLAFSNYIVRVNQSFSGNWKQFDMSSEEEMLQVLKVLNFLTEFYVSYSFAKVSIKDDFQEESGLDEEVCDFYSELVDKNYMEIKMNLIYNKLNRLEER